MRRTRKQGGVHRTAKNHSMATRKKTPTHLYGLNQPFTVVSRTTRQSGELAHLMKEAARTLKEEKRMRKTLKNAARRHTQRAQQRRKQELAELEEEAASILEEEAHREELYQMLLHAANEIDDDNLMSLMGRLSVHPRDVQIEEIENMLAGLQMRGAHEPIVDA